MMHVVIVWSVLIVVIIAVAVVDATVAAVCVACNVYYVAGYEC